MLSRLRPSARRHCPKAMLHAENGPPSRMKKAYCLAKGRMVSVAPSIRSRVSPPAKQTTASATPKAKLSTKEVLAMVWASCSRRAPSMLDTSMDAPVPTQKPSASSTMLMENTTPTAAVAEVPIWPTKKVSARL